MGFVMALLTGCMLGHANCASRVLVSFYFGGISLQILKGFRCQVLLFLHRMWAGEMSHPVISPAQAFSAGFSPNLYRQGTIFRCAQGLIRRNRFITVSVLLTLTWKLYPVIQQPGNLGPWFTSSCRAGQCNASFCVMGCFQYRFRRSSCSKKVCNQL